MLCFLDPYRNHSLLDRSSWFDKCIWKKCLKENPSVLRSRKHGAWKKMKPPIDCSNLLVSSKMRIYLGIRHPPTANVCHFLPGFVYFFSATFWVGFCQICNDFHVGCVLVVCQAPLSLIRYSFYNIQIQPNNSRLWRFQYHVVSTVVELKTILVTASASVCWIVQLVLIV